MDIEREDEVFLVGLLPYSEVHLAVITDQPSLHHAYLLVGSLSVFLLAEYPAPYLHVGHPLYAVCGGVDVFQASADGSKIMPFDRAVHADVLVTILSVHHIVIRPPAHLVQHPVTVAHDHGAAAPCEMAGQKGRNLDIGQRRLAGSVFPGEMPGEYDGVFREILRVIVFLSPFDESLFYNLVHNNSQI